MILQLDTRAAEATLLGMVALGTVEEETLMLEDRDWTKFVAFINRLDDHMRYSKTGPYREGVEHV